MIHAFVLALAVQSCASSGNMSVGHRLHPHPHPRPSPAPPSPPSPPSPASSSNQGPILIKENCQVRNLSIAAYQEKLVTTSADGRNFTMKWGGETRAFVVEKAMDTMPVENYVTFNMLNKEISYDVNLANVGCSCNAALFFVAMPGYSTHGSIVRGNSPNPYYCDGSDVGGVWCWEHDTMEANRYAWQTTPHKCDQKPFGPIDKCDRIGSGTNLNRANPGSMCPDSHCTIDSRATFRVHQKLHATSGTLTKIETQLVQGAKTLTFDACQDAAYMSSMSESLTKMKMVFQLWGSSSGGMHWLDGGACTGACSSASTMTIANIEIMPLNGSFCSQNTPQSDTRDIIV